jgi:hypothetical protein
VQRASGIPHALFEGESFINASDASRREVEEVCETVSTSLRAQRSNPFFLYAARWIASLRSQ